MRKNVLLIIITVLTIGFQSIHAQNGMKAFEHLGVGLDVSTTGVGLDVSVPVHSLFVLRGGFTMFPFKYSDTYNVQYGKEKIEDLLRKNPDVVAELERNNLPTTSAALTDDIDLDAKLGLINGKLVVDIYPIKTSSFHIVAGLYFGKERLMTLKGHADPTSIRFLNVVNDYFPNEDFKTFVSFEDYIIKADDNGNFDAAFKINPVKPYIGLGIGNDIPKKRVGFKFELGAMFHGKPKIVSDNGSVIKDSSIDGDSSGVTEILEKISVYPVVSFKLTGKIF